MKTQYITKLAFGVLIALTSSFTLLAQTCNCSFSYMNGSFESPNISGSYRQVNDNTVPGWFTTASDSRIEIWNSGFNGVPAADGNQFVEINATQVATLYQEICVEPGTVLQWSIYHRGRSGVDVATLGIGSTISNPAVIQTMSDGNSAWGSYSGTYTVPAGQTTTYLVLNSVSSAGSNSYGNFVDGFSVSIIADPCDSDMDGVRDPDDDYPNDPDRAFNNYYPSNGYGTLMFEDLWPVQGDYDFNDVVIDYRFKTVTNAQNYIVETIPTFTLRASGAAYNNGFGFQLANNAIATSDISVSGYNAPNGIVSLNSNGLENGQSIPTFIAFDQFFDLLQGSGGGVGVNTDSSVPTASSVDLELTISFTQDTYTMSDLDIASFNPFIFVDGQRDVEVHLPDYAPTSLVNTALFGTGDDDSNAGAGRYYKTTTNLPWALNVIESIPYPQEKIEIIECYEYFDDWSQPGGIIYQDWYKDLPGYRDNTKLY